jgi:hypothetical protein
MRHLKLTLGVAVSVCAFALAASPALAGEFVASNTGKTSGTSENEQQFKFGSIKINCHKTSAKGAVVTGSSNTYASSIKFTKCLTSAKIGTHSIFLAARFLTPLAIEYHQNGFVEVGSETEENAGTLTVIGGSAELKLNTGRTEEFEKSECHIRLEAQTLPLKATKEPEGSFSAATYSNITRPHLVTKLFPEGIQTGIEFSNAFKGIHYELEGEPCEEWGKEEGSEAVNGTYTGSFPQFLGNGNLEFH